MKVEDFKKKPRIPRESAFEKTVCDALGIYSRHMSDRLAGVPDRYVAGGTWIEFKVNGRPTMEQNRTMDGLVRAGDKVWVCTLKVGKDGSKIILEKWGTALVWVENYPSGVREIASVIRNFF